MGNTQAKNIINAYRDISISDLLQSLSDSHNFLVQKAQDELQSRIEDNDARTHWGRNVKRIVVKWKKSEIQELNIGKTEERFVELVNILATTERTLDALKFFAEKFGDDCNVVCCHASTSDDKNSVNKILPGDIVIETGEQTTICCEVNDVSSSRAGQNKKEESDLKSLGWYKNGECSAPDKYESYIATSAEFAKALSSKGRKWSDKHYKYKSIVVESTDTVLLKIVPRHNDSCPLKSYT